MADTPSVTIYHNVDCTTSRNTLGLIRNTGVEPTVIEYLKTPPSRETLVALVSALGMKSPRELLRHKGTPYDELGLDDPKWSDDDILKHMLAHPVLMERPIVITPLGTRVCRPCELVLDILPAPQRGAFVKEDGVMVIDPKGPRSAV